MKATFQLDSLRIAWQAAVPFVPSRSPKVALLNVKLSAFCDGSARLCATNDEFGGEVKCQAEVSRPGELLLPVAKFSQVIREFRGDSITVSEESGAVVAASGGSRVKIQTQDASEFPSPQAFSPSGEYEIPAALFSQTVSRLEPAIGDDPRFMLSGIKFDFSGQSIFAMATDSARIHATTIPSVAIGSPNGESIIVPAPALKAICRSIKPGPIRIHATESELRVQSDSARYWARLLSGRFPKIEYRPIQNKSFLSIPAGELASLIRCASIACDMESNAVDLTVSDSLCGITITAKARSSTGESAVEATVSDSNIRNGFKVSINHQMALGYLSQLHEEEEVEFRVGDGSGDVVYLSARELDYWAGIMPLAVE